jgi:maltose O-acetyltransferase
MNPSINSMVDVKEDATDIAPPKLTLAQQIQRQWKLVWIHFINLMSDVLGNDFIGCKLRAVLLKFLGIQVGSGCTIRGGTYFYGADLILGQKCYLNRNCYFDLSAPVELEDNVVVGHGVTFITAEHAIGSSDRRAGKAVGKKITIGCGAWIGANVTLLPGVAIGSGSVVAAGAVVTKNVAPHTIVAGVPAKVLRRCPMRRIPVPSLAQVIIQALVK